LMQRLVRGSLILRTTLLLVMAAIWVASLPPTAHAASTLTVTTTADLSTCTTALSLRCSINQANKDGSGDTITFHIPSTDAGCNAQARNGSPICTITIPDALNPLPALTANNTTMNGYTQPGAQPNTNPGGSSDNAILTVRLDGGSANNVEGVSISGTGDTIKGFSITSFDTGITTGSSDTVQGNFIGLEPDGSTLGTNATGLSVGDSVLI